MTSIWIFGISTILICSITNFIYGQINNGDQNPIGAYRVFQKTSFSCQGRSGYYADVETGCQIYHMCDGLGRQFSYSCPNTTLFQQRMLICDHWYMVNCSKAESDYTANLLIGQRDKPFVPEEENQLRTPRPDLLDRPYAPDYSGESFRKQFKVSPPIQNQIIDNGNSKTFDKSQTNSFPSPTRWSLNQAIRDERKRPQTFANRRNDEVVIEDNSSIDLGTSFSSHYNTSADISIEHITSSEVPTTSNLILSTSPSTTQSIRIPSKIYEPPLFYPVYNENYTEEFVPSSAAPFESISTTQSPTKPLTRPTTVAGKGFVPSNDIPTTPLIPTLPIRPEFFEPKPFTAQATPKKVTNKDHDFSKFANRPSGFQLPSFSSSTTEKSSGETMESTSVTSVESSSEFLSNQGSILDFDIPTGRQFSEPSPFKLESQSNIPIPYRDLLPPFFEFAIHDTATTQGPPIYYEWKIPSGGLEPPKFDPPIVVENEEIDDKSDNKNNGSNDNVAESSNTSFPFAHNPFLSAVFSKTQRSIESSTRSPTRSPTPRSIQDNSPIQNIEIFNNHKDAINETKLRSDIGQSSAEVDIQQLQKDLLIPDYLFPLENDARTGYEHTDIVNSFQLKIPERRSDDKPWYGENPDCPECHPSFVKPGTCEPCVKRR